MPATDATKNHLLASLPPQMMSRWLPHLELVKLTLGQVLHESGGVQSHVYFPATSIVSLLYQLEDGASAEIAIVGNEGLVGISLFMGGGSTTSRAVVQSAGAAIGCVPQCSRRSSSLGPYCTCFCATPKHLSPRWRRQQSAIDITPLPSSCADGC